MITENLATLKIHRLSNVQYEREVASGNIDETAIYLTPDDFIEDDAHPGCYYRMVDDEKEWVNPPMIEGSHYRTIERFNGKPVYVAHVKLEGDYAPECLIGVNLRAIRASGYMVYDRTGAEVMLPFHEGQEDYDLRVISAVYDDETELQVSVISPQFDPNFKCYAQIWYIKK